MRRFVRVQVRQKNNIHRVLAIHNMVSAYKDGVRDEKNVIRHNHENPVLRNPVLRAPSLYALTSTHKIIYEVIVVEITVGPIGWS